MDETQDARRRTVAEIFTEGRDRAIKRHNLSNEHESFLARMETQQKVTDQRYEQARGKVLELRRQLTRAELALDSWTIAKNEVDARVREVRMAIEFEVGSSASEPVTPRLEQKPRDRGSMTIGGPDDPHRPGYDPLEDL